MKPETLKSYFEKQINQPRPEGIPVIRFGLPPSANDGKFEDRPDDERLFYFVRGAGSKTCLQVMSVWKSDLDSFAETVKRGDYPMDHSAIPYLYF